jgi:chromosome segregation ATPase
LQRVGHFVVVMVVLSGNAEAMSHLRSLPKSQQVALSEAAKNTMKEFGMKPAKPVKFSTPDPQLSTGDSLLKPNQKMRIPTPGEYSATDNVVELHRHIERLLELIAQKDNAVSDLHHRLLLVEAERDQLQGKYAELLGEVDGRRQQGVPEREFLEALAKRDETIRKWTETASDMSDAMARLRERHRDLEAAQAASLNTITNLRQDLSLAASEKSALVQKLMIAEDAAAVSASARSRQSEEINALRNEILMLRAKVESASALNEADTDSSLHNESMDYRDQYKEQLDEAHRELAAAKRELLLLQRSSQSAVCRSTLEDVLDDSVGDAERSAVESRMLALEASNAALQSHLCSALNELDGQKQRVMDLTEEIFCLRASSDVVKAGAESARQDLVSMQSRFSEARAASIKEQAVLTSTLLQYGHRNLLLQQEQILKSAAAVSGSDSSAFDATPWSWSGVGGGRKGSAEASLSYLARHRRAFERSLLEDLGK